jgi:hypothetical protein
VVKVDEVEVEVRGIVSDLTTPQVLVLLSVINASIAKRDITVKDRAHKSRRS